MVRLVIKKAEEPQFLYETTVQIPVDELIKQIVPIYNGRLKVQRICTEIEQLAEHGITLPPNMQGLTDEQIEELKLKDEWAEKCRPPDYIVCPDDVGRRNGEAPCQERAEILKKTCKEAKDLIHKNKVASNQCLSMSDIQEALDILRGAVMIVYPMDLPPHDPIAMEFNNEEDLSGTQASLDVIEESNAALWFAGKELKRENKLLEHSGKNEKTKLVVKIQKRGSGAPQREAVVSEDDQKAMMAYYYKKQEQFKKLQETAEEDSSDMGSAWANTKSLKSQLQGMNNISFR